jgi:dynein light chain LC8-type
MKMHAIHFILNSQAEKLEDLAKKLKLDFDLKFHCSWQCVVGKNFGCDIEFEAKHYIYFYVGSLAILLWKAG